MTLGLSHVPPEDKEQVVEAMRILASVNFFGRLAEYVFTIGMNRIDGVPDAEALPILRETRTLKLFLDQCNQESIDLGPADADDPTF